MDTLNELIQPNQLQLVDVNDDCVEKIFIFLSFDDLLNIADSCKRLKSAADLAFVRKYRSRCVNFFIQHTHRNGPVPLNNRMHISDFRTSLRLLRCFGHLFHSIHIQWSYVPAKKSNKLIHYVNKYCCESLIKLQFREISKLALENEFQNVETVIFDRCSFDGASMDIAKCFPKLRNLTLSYINGFVNGKTLTIHIKHLKCLSIFVVNERDRFALEDFLAMIKLNPQLRTLKFHNDFSMRFLDEISKNLNSLERIEFNFFPDSFKLLDDKDSINFRNLKHLKIDYFGYKAAPMPKIPFTSQRLESVVLSFCNYQLNDDFVAFLQKHSTITLLKIDLANRTHISNRDIMVNIAKSLPELREAIFSLLEFSLEEVIVFLNACKTLNKFYFVLSDQSQFNALTDQFSGSWHICSNASQIEMVIK